MSKSSFVSPSTILPSFAGYASTLTKCAPTRKTGFVPWGCAAACCCACGNTAHGRLPAAKITQARENRKTPVAFVVFANVVIFAIEREPWIVTVESLSPASVAPSRPARLPSTRTGSRRAGGRTERYRARLSSWPDLPTAAGRPEGAFRRDRADELRGDRVRRQGPATR